MKKDCKWASELIIDSHKLFELCLDMTSSEKNMSAEAKHWINMCTEASNDTTLWFERDLDDYLKEIH